MLYQLADLLRGVPLELERIARGEGDYGDLLARLGARAQRKGIDAWLDAVLEHHSQRHASSARSLVHRVCYQALVDMRAQADQTHSMKVFDLTDIFHNTPLALEVALEGSESYEEALRWIRERAEFRGCRAWLDSAMEGARAAVDAPLSSTQVDDDP